MTRRPTYVLPIGALVSKTFDAYGRNIVPFTVLSALVLSPWIALRLFLHFEGGKHEVVDLLAVMVQALLTYVLTGAVTYGVVQQLRGEPAGFGDSVNRGLQSFFRVLGTGILCGLRIFLFTLLLYIPGIIETVRLYVAIPAAVMEGKGGGQAVERSKTLTDGSRWQIFGSWLLMFVVGIGLVFLAGFLLVSVSQENERLLVWFEIGFALFINAFSSTMMAVCYFMLRQGKENVDVKQLAAVFD